MNHAPESTVIRERPSATELRGMPMHEREAILAAQAALAEEIYRRDLQLTDFEAFGEDDLHGESSSAETR